MGQQPNVEIPRSDRPREVPEPDPPRRWRPTRAGVITAPDQVPKGRNFGRPGPDTGYALKLIRGSDVALTSGQEKVVAALMGARSSLLGRAPTAADLAASLVIAGIGEGLPEHIVERGGKWAAATAHEGSPGQMAVGEAEDDLLVLSTDQVRRRLRIIGH